MRIVKLAHFNDQQLLIVDVLTILYKSVWVKGSEVHERFDCTLLNSSSWCNADDALILVVCRDGQLRLAGGSTPYEGRVEVCQNELWGTICDNPWNNDAATVVCTQLGHSRQSKLVMTPNTFLLKCALTSTSMMKNTQLTYSSQFKHQGPFYTICKQAYKQLCTQPVTVQKHINYIYL